MASASGLKLTVGGPVEIRTVTLEALRWDAATPVNAIAAVKISSTATP